MKSKAAPIDLPVQFLASIGAKKGEAFRKSGIYTLRDLLLFMPRGYIERTHTTLISALTGDKKEEVTVIGTITDAQLIKGRGGKSRYEAILEDESGGMKLAWFRSTHQIKKWIVPGFSAAFSGKAVRFGHQIQMSHPEVTTLAKGEVNDLVSGKGRWIALYKGNKDFEKAGLDARGLRTLIDRIVGEHIKAVPEIWPEEWQKELGIVSIHEALAGMHRPRNKYEHEKALNRLKFDELLVQQLLWEWTRKRKRNQKKGIAYPKVGETTRDLIKRLPFKLTETQNSVLREIWADMQQPWPMSRLLQGDVGSGKTVVALVAMTIAVENGYQAALMVPTEILAEQHFLTSKKFLEDLGVSVRLLTGSRSSKARQEILAELASGQPGIIIGTHALIQDTVKLPNLGFTVIDEQHRFGVAQRLNLMAPNLEVKPDVLVMTATPIPRSLALSIYGDLDVSRNDEMPAGRGTIKTIAVNGDDQREELYASVRTQVEAGGRAYIVFPLVGESEKLDLQAAIEGREALLEGPLKGLSVGLLHGRMKIQEKEEAMAAFKSGETPVLVATTVIEVGVDVPEATVMLVEHAERFGLAQLHQLRGRVARGGRDSNCYLVAYPPVSDTARARIKTMVATLDGFELAEQDLIIRGAGDFFGIKQSGLPDLKFADVVADQAILIKARNVATDLLAKGDGLAALPELESEFKRVGVGRAAWLEVG